MQKRQEYVPEFTYAYQAGLFLSYVRIEYVDVVYIIEQLVLNDIRFSDTELFSLEMLNEIVEDLCYFESLKTRVYESKLQIKLPNKKELEPTNNVINAFDRFQKNISQLRAA
jgi:hypothetical protein